VEYGRVALWLWTPLRACSSSLIRTAGTAVEFVPEQWRPDSTPFGACFAALPKPFGLNSEVATLWLLHLWHQEKNRAERCNRY
jgi:hypothetical protein